MSSMVLSFRAVIAPAAASPLAPGMIGQPGVWAGIAPSLHVCDQSFMRDAMPLRIPDERMRPAVSAMRREGYLHIPPLDWALPLRAIVDVVRWLAAQGAPPVLAYHFDEFW